MIGKTGDSFQSSAAEGYCLEAGKFAQIDLSGQCPVGHDPKIFQVRKRARDFGIGKGAVVESEPAKIVDTVQRDQGLQVGLIRLPEFEIKQPRRFGKASQIGGSRFFRIQEQALQRGQTLETDRDADFQESQFGEVPGFRQAVEGGAVERLAGRWIGSLIDQVEKPEILQRFERFQIGPERRDAEGGLFVILQIDAVADVGEAWLYSPTQIPGALPVDRLKIDGRQLELEVETVNGRYEAEVGGKVMEGTWNQGAPIPLKLKWSGSRPEQE